MRRITFVSCFCPCWVCLTALWLHIFGIHLPLLSHLTRPSTRWPYRNKHSYTLQNPSNQCDWPVFAPTISPSCMIGRFVSLYAAVCGFPLLLLSPSALERSSTRRHKVDRCFPLAHTLTLPQFISALHLIISCDASQLVTCNMCSVVVFLLSFYLDKIQKHYAWVTTCTAGSPSPEL